MLLDGHPLWTSEPKNLALLVLNSLVLLGSIQCKNRTGDNYKQVLIPLTQTGNVSPPPIQLSPGRRARGLSLALVKVLHYPGNPFLHGVFPQEHSFTHTLY